MAKRTGNSRKRSWRDFEHLVARIEAALAPYGATVKSPDRLLDHATQSLREVDASIRYKVGTADILIMIECRDRTKVQDTLWIEQLARKQQDLLAAKCIAVSSSGFSKTAVQKAAAHGIELRRLDTITAVAIESWRPVAGTWLFEYKLPYVDLSFSCDPDPEQFDDELDRAINRELGAKYYLEDPCLHDVDSGEIVSVGDYCLHLINQSFGSLSDADRSKLQVDTEYTFSFAGPPRYTVDTSQGRLFVFAVAFKVVFSWIKDYAFHPRTVFTYSDQTRDLVRGVELEMTNRREPEPTKKIALHHDLVNDTGRITILDGDKNDS
jgi:hypothetical protein